MPPFPLPSSLIVAMIMLVPLTIPMQSMTASPVFSPTTATAASDISAGQA